MIVAVLTFTSCALLFRGCLFAYRYHSDVFALFRETISARLSV